MSVFNNGKSVEVEVVDNGWVLTWHDPRADDDSYGRAMGIYPPPKPRPTRGREIFTDNKKLMKRLQGFL